MALVRRCLLLSLFVSVVARQKSNKEWGQMSAELSRLSRQQRRPNP